MAYAPYINRDAGDRPLIKGAFTEVDCGNRFEFAERTPAERASFAPEAGHFIFVGENATRAARVLRTVAYIAVDEDEKGNAIYEKWQIKKRVDYKGG